MTTGSLQAIADQMALDMLPKIKEIIKGADSFSANQMQCYTLRECMNCSPSIDNMSPKQLEKFQDELTEIFKYKEWI